MPCRSCRPPPAAAPPRSRWPSRARPRRTTWPGSRPSATPSAPPAGCGSTPTAAGTSTPPCGWCGCSTGSRPRVRRAALPHGRGARGGAPPRRRAGCRRRVDPPGRGPAAGRPAGRGRHRRPQGAAARWRRGLPADRRADRPAGGRVLGPGVLGRHRRRDRAGRSPARAAVRLRAGDAAAAGRRRDHGAAAGRRRGAPRRPAGARRRRGRGGRPGDRRIAGWAGCEPSRRG